MTDDQLIDYTVKNQTWTAQNKGQIEAKIAQFSQHGTFVLYLFNELCKVDEKDIFSNLIDFFDKENEIFLAVEI